MTSIRPTALRKRSRKPTPRTILALAIALGVAGIGAVVHSKPVSAQTPATSVVADLKAGEAEADIDAFWSAMFDDAGIAYVAPAIVGFDTPITTGGCGDADPWAYTAFYCEFDATVYYSISGVNAEYERFGDAGWVHMMAHEWGHHVQMLLGIIGPGTVSDGVSVELQATCLAGSYVRDAAARDLVSAGAIAVMEDMFAGDANHGSREALLAAFTDGHTGGPATCGVTL